MKATISLLGTMLLLTLASGARAATDACTTTANDAIRLSYGLAWGLYWTPYGKATFKEGNDNAWQHYVMAFTERGTGLLISSGLGALALGATYAGLLVALGLSDDDRTVVTRAARKITRRRPSPAGMARADVPGEPS